MDLDEFQFDGGLVSYHFEPLPWSHIAKFSEKERANGSIEQAAKFGASVRGLHHLLGQNYLLLCDGIGKVHTINRMNTTVRKLRQETFGKLMIDPLKDLTIFELDLAEIAELPESFHSLAYGVADENGQKLEVNGYLYFLSH